MNFESFKIYSNRSYEKIKLKSYAGTVRQARRQDSVTGGAEINYGGHEKFILVWIKRTR